MKKMTNEEFIARLTTEGELARTRILDFLANGDVDAFFARMDDRFIESEDLEFLRLLLADSMEEVLQTDLSCMIPQQRQALMNLMLDLQLASEASRLLLMRLCHQMREEADYSGLSLMYEACTADLPFSIYQQLGGIIFNDLYPEQVLSNRTESDLYEYFLREIDARHNAIIDEATAAWDDYMKVHEDESCKDDDDDEIELTYDRFRLLCAQADTDADMPTIMEAHRRIIKTCSLLMTFAGVAIDIFGEYMSELRAKKNYGEINSVLTYLQQQPHGTYDDYCYFCSVVMGDSKDEAE